MCDRGPDIPQGAKATAMSTSPPVETAPRFTDEQWHAVVAAARDLLEKVSGLSDRLAVVEQQVNCGDRPVPARPRPSGQ
jgi:hypothetical protein